MSKENADGECASASTEMNSDWLTREHGVPVARYVDPDFARLEAKRLWPQVWQMACRLEQIPRPGSYTVYQILDEEVVVVRVSESVVKAYRNVCPHRATALAVGSGRFQLGNIICPFHGWKWDLEGRSIHVLNREEFASGCLSQDDIDLKEVHVEIWAGFVYINLSADPMPFEQFVAPIADIVEGVKLGEMKFHYHYLAEVNANWKIALEAFMEAYHVPQTHPQIVPGSHEDYTSIYTYLPLEGGHGLFHSGGAHTMGRIPLEKLASMSREDQLKALVRGILTLQAGQDAQAHIEELDIARSMLHRPIPEGLSVGQYFQTVLREHYAAQGRSIGTVEALAGVGDMHIFPHVIFLPTYGNAVMYRARPRPDNHPDWCIFEMYALRTYPEGVEPPKWETIVADGPLDNAKSWYLIPSQDFTSIVRQQRGMRSSAIECTLLSERQESLILNMHHAIDSYLSG